MADRSKPPHGVLVIDKPRGPTSHGVVARVRKVLGTREVGHAGTLDPMATGVLVVAVGEATKLVPYLTAEDKAYEATIALGVATDTLDADGTVTERAPVNVTADAIEAALEHERARTSQVPPAFSAIKIAGERAHDLARRGDAPEMKPRDVAVRTLRLVHANADTLSITLEVAKGYYVRSLARDLGAALGTVAHLTALRRTRSGSFGIDEAIALDGDLPAHLSPLAAAAGRVLPIARLTDAGAVDARHGRVVRATDIAAPGTGMHAWLDEAGELVAIGTVDGAGRVVRGFTST